MMIGVLAEIEGPLNPYQFQLDKYRKWARFYESHQTSLLLSGRQVTVTRRLSIDILEQSRT